jgi:hypothetical protein
MLLSIALNSANCRSSVRGMWTVTDRRGDHIAEVGTERAWAGTEGKRRRVPVRLAGTRGYN